MPLLQNSPEAFRIFDMLKHSDVFLPDTRHDYVKYIIIKRLLAVRPELCDFAAKVEHNEHELTGFFVERCARISSCLPKNTARAEQYAQKLISYLHDHKLSNPDHIWITIRGRRITIDSIGEVKSHPSVLRHRPLQSTMQEQNIRQIIEDKSIQNILATTSHVVLGCPFNRYMIFPRSANGPYHLPLSVPDGWQIKELEFSLPEMTFLLHIFLDRKSNGVSYDYPEDLYTSFTETIYKRSRAVITELFHSVPKIQKDSTAKDALTAWAILFHNVPTDQESINQVVTWTQKLTCAKNALFPFPANAPLRHGGLHKSNKKLYNTLLQRFPQVPRTLTLACINTLKNVKQRLPEPPYIIEKKDIDIFSLL